ncbi:MaoC family dehydratase [Pseudoprimorskyibacter insulae]|uniref:Putative enoyl-CoA hydratase 1 n=1 Tax=Pseudoprimorskyibacter insulae TaxID=1695997 RepID=A0A2R8AP49_9RHOB|nr:MaoC family dehydratase [Pseudoprimorskyibacter insulae]SPF77846.1 putative enoyl-CoA hydratase 1 [Pseudoprimorskyibacter insulae]
MSIEIFQNFAPATSNWHMIDQARIDAFADVTNDHQFIHVDPVKAAETPLGGTIAHGYLTLSMLATMAYDIMPDLPDSSMGLNYGLNKVRFLSPVRSGKRIRGRYEVARCDQKDGRLTIEWLVTVEIEGEERPALVAEWINLFILEA